MQNQIFLVLYHPRMIRTSGDRSCSRHIICVYEAPPNHGLTVVVGVVGSGGLAEDSDSIVCEHEKGHEKGYERRNARDRDKVGKAAGPGRGPSGRVVEALLWPHEVAGTEGPVGRPRASRNVEGVGPSPASG